MDRNTQLEREIQAAAQAYYTDGSSKLTDAEWDSLVEQLKSQDPDSEILKQIGCGYSVNADTTPGKKVKHKYGIVGSLEKCRTWDEIKSQFKNTEVDISLKLDGISVVLYYDQGKLYQALTRGDGEIGIDITDKIQIILKGHHYIDTSFTGAIRGEIVMSFANFNKFKELHPEAKNPRNSVAGIINGKELVDELKYIDVVVYSVVGHESNHSEQIIKFGSIENIRAWLYKEFVYSVPYIETLLTKSTIIDDVFNIRDIWSDIWPSDGLVITSKQLHRINNKIIQDSQAFKFKSETAQTEIINVEWNMSKTRYAIPRIKVKPVQLSGTTVQYCTGYNAKYIADNHVGVGSIVEIEKRGEIIPNINKIIAVNGNWEIPQFCPHCDCELQWEGVHLVCKNTKCNNSVMQDTLIWTNIIAPVDNLGELLKEKFFVEIYDSVPSIETLMYNKPTAYQNAPEGTQTYRMKQMLDKLFSDESINLVDAIKALNIPRFGDVNADKLSQYPEQVKTLMNLACDGSCADGLKLASLFEEFKTKIGDANTESIKKHMDKVARLRFIQKRIDWSEQITEHPSESKGKVAITGKLSIKRSEFEKELKSAGYSPAEISKDTKFLITNNPNSSSSKNKKADAWGIVKITEQKFRQKYM